MSWKTLTGFVELQGTAESEDNERPRSHYTDILSIVNIEKLISAALRMLDSPVNETLSVALLQFYIQLME